MLVTHLDELVGRVIEISGARVVGVAIQFALNMARLLSNSVALVRVAESLSYFGSRRLVSFGVWLRLKNGIGLARRQEMRKLDGQNKPVFPVSEGFGDPATIVRIWAALGKFLVGLSSQSQEEAMW